MKNFLLSTTLFVTLILGYSSCSKNKLPDDDNGKGTDTTVTVVNHAQHLSYYVDTSGNDNNDGLSPSKPWKTLAKVSSTTFVPGDKIFLKSGQVWNENLYPLGSGNADSLITLGKYGGDSRPIINGTGTSEVPALKLADQSYWEISGLEITNKSTTDNALLRGISVSGSDASQSTHIYITNCFIHDVQSASLKSAVYNKINGGIIFTGPVSNILVKGCHIKDCLITGIRTASTPLVSSVVIDSNLIENVYGDGIVLAGVKDSSKIIRNVLRNVCYSPESANFAGAWTIRSSKTLIAYNEVSGITGGGVNDGQPFDSDLDTDGDVFEYNYTHDNKKGFILLMPSAKNVVVRYNLSIRDNGVATGYQRRRLINNTSSSTGTLFHNNTFVIDTTLDYIFESGFTGEFSNNIIYSSATITRLSGSTLNSASSFYRNCFYTGTLVTTLPNQSNIVGNISDDPLLVNTKFLGNGRLNGVQNALSLQPQSPCITQATYIASNENRDYLGNNMTNKSFMGAIMPPNAPDYQMKYNDITMQLLSVLRTSQTTADTYVDQNNSTTNYGTSQMVYVKAGGANTVGTIRAGLLRFNTSSVVLDSLNSSKYKVVIRLKAFKKEDVSPNIGLQLYLLSSTTWAENTITYSTRPTLSQSLVYVPNSGVEVNVDQSTMGGENIDFDITQYLKTYYTTFKIIPSVLNIGIQSYSTTTSGNYIGNTGVQFYSKDFGVDSIAPRILTGTLKDTTIRVIAK